MLSPVIAIKNRSGMFAVLTPNAAKLLTQGYMKLYWNERLQRAEVESITRTRRPLTEYDPEVRFVFFAIDQDGGLVTEQVAS